MPRTDCQFSTLQLLPRRTVKSRSKRTLRKGESVAVQNNYKLAHSNLSSYGTSSLNYQKYGKGLSDK